MKEFETNKYMKKQAQQYEELDWSGEEEFEIDRQGQYFTVKCFVQVTGTAISEHVREYDFERSPEDYNSYTIQNLYIDIGTPIEIKNAVGQDINPFELTPEEQNDCEETMRIVVTDNVENYIDSDF